MIIYLYVKQHSITGLKYFGKTIQSDPYKYLGSGTRWLKHIKKHGKEHVKTIELYTFEDQDEALIFALRFSKENKIVESDDWANIEEETLLGGSSGRIVSKETKIKLGNATRGKSYYEIYDEETANRLKKCRSEANLLRPPMKESTKIKISETRKQLIASGNIVPKMPDRNLTKNNRNSKRIACIHCGVISNIGNIKRWHNENCKLQN